MEEKSKEETFDVLDMHNYRMEKLPVREKSKFEKVLMNIGVPLAIISFVLILFFIDIPFLQNLNADTLSKSVVKNYQNIGLEEFIYSNKAMLAIFVASLILWITEAIPNYLTSLILVLTKVLPEEVAYAQLGISPNGLF